MLAKYEISREGSKFVVTDPFGMKVGEFKTQRIAKTEVRQIAKDAAMLETARISIAHAVRKVMKKHRVSRSIAAFWIREASGL